LFTGANDFRPLSIIAPIMTLGNGGRKVTMIHETGLNMTQKGNGYLDGGAPATKSPGGEGGGFFGTAKTTMV